VALMGEIAGAGLLAHVPTIMLPRSERMDLNEGKEISLVPGLERLRREVFEVLDYDTVVVLDSHWHTTVEFVVAAQPVRAGLFTSDELPRGMCRIPYDWRGDPELAQALAAAAESRGTWITAIDDPYLPVHYATVNLWTYLGRGLPDKRWVSVSTAQTGDTEDFLRVGRALSAAILELDRRVLLVASGAMSHTFWSLRELRSHEASDPAHIRTAEARAADLERIGWLAEGDHARVLQTMPEFLKFRPEARFGPYLMMLGALGGAAVTAPGRQVGVRVARYLRDGTGPSVAARSRHHLEEARVTDRRHRVHRRVRAADAGRQRVVEEPVRAARHAALLCDLQLGIDVRRVRASGGLPDDGARVGAQLRPGPVGGRPDRDRDNGRGDLRLVLQGDLTDHRGTLVRTRGVGQRVETGWSLRRVVTLLCRIL
jgi:aromatic ring-opening dioxygenase catalytic subunit (LigB family)